MQAINFSVDSELLRELGERLVGRQYIALAELVKNSFDADATRVEIRIESDAIQVSDNGHGLTEEDFAKRWMRVGSTHKVTEMTSPVLKRRLTGSKGVGRLAVQFLANELELTSIPDKIRLQKGHARQELYAIVDWNTAVQAGELTQATALYELRKPGSISFPAGKPHGTTVKLSKLKHEWDSKEFEDLAREIWFLQAPFRALTGESEEAGSSFEVDLFAPDPEFVTLFNTQMARILDLYTSRVVGRLLPRKDPKKRQLKRSLRLSLDLEGERTPPYEFQIPVRGERRCMIESLDFEIRIFTLQHRQPYGIPVQKAREYMAQWGGVHIYDSGFRIPYAGPAADWLRLEVDHSHRLAQSRLLPRELNVQMGLNHLPTNSRVLGVVNIDTNHEGSKASSCGDLSGQHLQIQVSRDRLVSNEAFRQLQDAVRFALDYYATRLAALRIEDRAKQRKLATPRFVVENVWDVLRKHDEVIPSSVSRELDTELTKTIESVREQAEWTSNQASLLGAMATVGSTAIAFDHQLNQQLGVLEYHTSVLDDVSSADRGITEAIGSVAASIKQWIQDVRNTRTVFSPITDERNRTAVDRFRARPTIETMTDSLKVVLRGVTVDVSGVDENMLLPVASYPVWMAVFHNLMMNASNAMLDSELKRITVTSLTDGRRRAIRIHDTGVGIDLRKAERLFEPLARDLDISADRRALGYGGTGLGLAIVRMLATDVMAEVRFIEPELPFNTCFELSWMEES